MSTITLQTMGAKEGHKQKKFDSTDTNSLRDMVKYIRDKILNDNFVLYGAKKGKELMKLLDKSMKESGSEYTIEEKLLKNDSFIMRENTRLVMAPQLQGG